MNQPEFGNAMSDLVNSFPSKNYSTSQTQLIFNQAKELSKHQFDKILEHFIMIAKFPSPAELIGAIKLEKSKSKIWDESKTEFKLLCEDCADTGYLFVNEPSIPQPLLMRCYCPNGASNDEFESIPQWSRTLSAVYVKQKFPIESFKPTGTFDNFIKSLANSEPIKIMQRWQARKQFSNEFWKYQISKQQQTTEGSNV